MGAGPTPDQVRYHMNKARKFAQQASDRLNRTIRADLIRASNGEAAIIYRVQNTDTGDYEAMNRYDVEALIRKKQDNDANPEPEFKVGDRVCLRRSLDSLREGEPCVVTAYYEGILHDYCVDVVTESGKLYRYLHASRFRFIEKQEDAK